MRNHSNKWRWTKIIRAVFVSIGLLALPLFIDDEYLLHVLINIFMVSISVVGVRLILLCGSVSLGQAAFVAIGAYTSGILVMKTGMSTWFALPLAGLMAAAVGAVIGWPALKLRGIYFIIVTLCIGQAIMHYISNLDGLTGGLNGIYGIPRPNSIEIASFTIADFDEGKIPYYYYALSLLVLCLWVMSRIDRSRLGAILRSISENDRLAASAGIPVMRFRVLAFTIACFFGGLSGGFYAHYFVFLQPYNFTAWDSIYYLVFVIIGGARSVIYPVIGCAIMLGFFEFARPLAMLQPMVYGFIFVAIILFAPEGLVGLQDKIRNGLTGFLGKFDKSLISKA